MSAAFGNGAVKEFSLALDELNRNLAFIKASSRLRPRLGAYVNWAVAIGDAKSLVNEFLNQKEVEFSSQYRGMLVIMAGFFEDFVRKLVREVVGTIAAKAGSYDALNEQLKNHNINRTGKALLSVLDPPDHLRFDYALLAKNLSTCIPGSAAFVLNADAFSLFISNVTPDHLVETFRSMGVELHWDEFGRESKMESLLGSKGVHETGKAISSSLKNFIKLRNQLAHTGVGGVVVTEANIEHYLSFFRLLAPLLAKNIAARI